MWSIISTILLKLKDIFKVAVSHVRCKSSNILEKVQDRDVTTDQ